MNKLIFSFAVLGLVFSSCHKDPIEEPGVINPTCIELSGTQQTPLTLTNHIADPSIPDYCVTANYFIQAAVVVEPGVTIQINNGVKVHVQTNGYFNCVGTATEKIRIRGAINSTAGQWENIHFSSNDVNNQLIHTYINGGGNATTYPAMIFIGYQGNALIENCGISFSSTNGIMTETFTTNLGGISNCDISLCGLYPMVINARLVDKIESSITGGGNTYNLIDVRESQLQSPAIWHATSFPYHINGSQGIASALTVDPGTIFRFAAGAEMRVGTNGSLNCVGTAAQNIIFRGDTDLPGSWEGIVFTGSSSTLNRFENCQFSYGGGNATYTGMITLWTSAYVRIGNSSIMNSARWGILNENGVNTLVDDGNNTFGGNASGNIGT